MCKRLLLLFVFPVLLFSKEVLTVAIDYEYSPVTYKSFEGKPEGLFVDFWRLWGKKSGYEIEFKFYDWDSSVEAVKNGEVIFHSGLTPDKDWMVGSNKFYELKTSFYKLKDKELSKKVRIGTIDSFFMELAKEKYPNSEIIKYKDYLPLIKAILNGDIDLIIDDEIAVDVFLLQKGVKSKFEVIDDNSFYSDINVITNQKNQKYIDIFNKYLKKISIEEFASVEDDILGENIGYFNHKIIKKNSFFTKKEQEWLDKKETIRYVYDSDWAPFEWSNEINQHTGIVADILELIKSKTGINFEPVYTKKWADAVELAKNNKVDMYSAVLETKDRKKYMNYTNKYIYSYSGVLIANAKNKEKYINLSKDLKNKKIGITKGNALGSYMKEKYPNLSYVEVDSTQDGFEKVKNKTIDIFCVNSATAHYYINKKGYTNTHIAGNLDIQFGLKIAISKNKPLEVIAILNKVINVIEKKEIASIYNKWANNNDTIFLNKKEKEYLQSQKPIRYVYDPNREPFEYKNDLGKHSGITAEILNLISKKSSLKFEAIETSSWKESTKLIKDKTADMFSFVIENKIRNEYLDFTKKTLFKVPVVFVTHIDDNNIYEHAKFDLKNKKIGIVKGRAIYKKLLKRFPDFHFIELSSANEGFEKVDRGDIDMFAVNKSTAKYYIKIKGFSNTKIATSIDMFFEFKIALQKSLPAEVLSIINRSLDSISEKDINEIYNKFINIKVDHKTNWKLLIQIGIVILLIFLFILYNNKKLKSMVKKKTKEMAILLDEFDENVIASKTDLTGKITYVSKAFCEACEYSEDELIGKPHSIIRHPDMPKEAFAQLWKTIKSGETWRGEVKNLKKNGGFYWVDATIFPEFDTKGVVSGYSAIRHDITAQKEVEDLTANLELKINERTKELDEERNFIGSIISSSQDALIVIDRLSIVTTWNDSAVKIFGYTKKEMIGNSIEKIIPHKFRELHHVGVDRVSSNGKQNLLGKGAIEIEALHKNGNIIPIDLALNTFTLNGKIFFSANIRDISERKELTDKLENEKQFIQTLLNSQEQIIITTDGKSLLTANETFFDFFEVESVEAFIKTYNSNCICETFNIDAPNGYLQATIGKQRWIDYILSCSFSKIHKAMITKGDVNYIFSVTVAKLPGDKGIKSAVFTDITDMENAKLEIEAIHKHTRESIEYASLIQGALIPDNRIFRNYFQDYFAIWHPKDTIGGDIYLFEELRDDDECLLMVIDCTGHGVPGAFVTMLVKAIERQIVAKIKHSDEIVSPANLLSVFNRNMKQLLKQEDVSSISNAGFDGGIIYYNKKDKIIKYAGAETPLFYVDGDELKVIKGDRYSVGYKKCAIDYKYKDHIIDIKEGMQFYLTTDGYLDQNGGEKSFPFGKKRFQSIIKEYHLEQMADQQEVFLYTLDEYQGDEETNDDVTLIGFKI